MKGLDALVLRELEKGDPLLNAHDESISWRRRVYAARRNIHEASRSRDYLFSNSGRGAAAAAALLFGWGMGWPACLGAAKVLESMLGGHLPAPRLEV